MQPILHSTVDAHNNTVKVLDLKSNHREADKRITLHTVFSSSTDAFKCSLCC